MHRARKIGSGSLVAAACLVFGATVANADGDKPRGPNRSSIQGHTTGTEAGAEPANTTPMAMGRAPEKAPLPVKLSIVAQTPDPPWTMRLENTGEHAIRIAGDIRLLSFDLVSKAGTQHCSAPAALRPSKVTKARELYLKPGEAFQEDFDPRLYCFGTMGDALTNATVVHPHYGFASHPGKKGPFIAQGIDDPPEFQALGIVDAADMTLSSPPIAKNSCAPGAWCDSNPAPAEPAPFAAGATPSAAPSAQPQRGVAGSIVVQDGYYFDDRNKGRLGVTVDRFEDANAARDITLNVHLTNEGTRDVITALRGRMISFTVEQLGHDNRATKTADCSGQDQPHPISAEMLRGMGGGQTVTIPLLVAEMCPPLTFDRPGLYRVTPRLDTTETGEAADLEAYIGQALTRQSVLVRLATGREDFEDGSPSAWKPPSAKTDAAPSKPAR